MIIIITTTTITIILLPGSMCCTVRYAAAASARCRAANTEPNWSIAMQPPSAAQTARHPLAAHTAETPPAAPSPPLSLQTHGGRARDPKLSDTLVDSFHPPPLREGDWAFGGVQGCLLSPAPVVTGR
jgi:hypothetical protein